MIPYPKIQTVFKRDPETKYRTLLEGEFSTPELAFLSGNEWEFTEKIDGTNIRIFWDSDLGTYRIGGRTDNAQIPTFLFDKLLNIFAGKFPVVFPDNPKTVQLFGEGYGAKIQKGGGDYIPDGVGFILFDVVVDGIWLKRDSVNDIASKFEIPHVPIVGYGNLWDMVATAKMGFNSHIIATPRLAEGVVARPRDTFLLDRFGKPVITKVKTRDFFEPTEIRL